MLSRLPGATRPPEANARLTTTVLSMLRKAAHKPSDLDGSDHEHASGSDCVAAVRAQLGSARRDGRRLGTLPDLYRFLAGAARRGHLVRPGHAARWVRPVAILANGLMLASTPIDGGHYFVDVFAGIALALAAIAAAHSASRVLQRRICVLAPKLAGAIPMPLPRGQAARVPL